MGCSPSGTGCSSVGPHGATDPASKPAPAWAPLSTALQVLAGACSSTGSPRGHSFFQASTCSSVGSLARATGGDLLHHGTPCTAGGQPASPWSLSRVAREESLLRYFGHLLLPASSLTLVSAELFLSHCLTLLSNCRLTAEFFFFYPFLNSVITEALPPSLIGLALASSGSVSEPASTGFIKHGGSFQQLLTEATPIVPPLPKPCMQTHNSKLREFRILTFQLQSFQFFCHHLHRNTCRSDLQLY